MSDARLNLASKRLGASVMATSDEHFAAAENLVKDSESVSLRGQPGPRGTPYDGWETRRHSPDHEWALVRLGVPGIIDEIVADTAHFHGNAPVAVEVDGLTIDGYPNTATVQDSPRRVLVSRSECGGNRLNTFASQDRLITSHLWLRLLPDGGVSRLRAYGSVLLDPRRIRPCMDLASLAAGGHIVGSSTAFMPPTNVLMPRTASCIDEGWETGRRRTTGYDYLVIGLADIASIAAVEVDTTHFGGNAPDSFSAEYLPEGADADTQDAWRPLVAHTPVLPDQRHVFPIAEHVETAQVRVRIYPDGGISAVRIFGDLVPASRGRVISRWLSALPASFVRETMHSAGLSAAGVDQIVANSDPATTADSYLAGLSTADVDRFERLVLTSTSAPDASERKGDR